MCVCVCVHAYEDTHNNTVDKIRFVSFRFMIFVFIVVQSWLLSFLIITAKGRVWECQDF